MYTVVFHDRIIDDLGARFTSEQMRTLIRKTERRLVADPRPDGRVIKRLHHIIVTVFFEYKVRQDWRAIFYIDEMHAEVRVLGFIPKNLGARLFDRNLESFLAKRYGHLFST